MLLGTLVASLLGNMLACKGVIRAGEESVRIGYGSERSSFKKKKLVPPHPLTNFEIQMYCQNKCIVRINLYLMGFIKETTYLIK